jgi:hypothetical protein
MTEEKDKLVEINLSKKENRPKINGQELTYISKKLAAIASYKRSKLAFFLCLTGVAASVMAAVFTAVHPYAGSASAIIFSALFGYHAIRATKDMKYLEKTYNLDGKGIK